MTVFFRLHQAFISNHSAPLWKKYKLSNLISMMISYDICYTIFIATVYLQQYIFIDISSTINLFHPCDPRADKAGTEIKLSYSYDTPT